MKKKSIFYISAAIALTIVIFVTYSAYNTYRLVDKMESIETRIQTVNFFIKNIENDLNNGIYIAGFRTMLSFNQFITTNGTYIDDINARFTESFLNGTIQGQSLSLMQGATFTDWANKISAEADKIDIKFNFTIIDAKISQSDPWSVNIGINMTMDVRDKKNTSYWIRNRYLTNKIDIIGFEDPLYVINSNGRITNTITQSNISPFVVNGDVTNLIILANYSYYNAHNDSPSFLMRLQGKFGNSTNGIESLVNLDEFQQQNIPLKDRSIVDYLYFGNESTVNYRINNTPEWFKIDSSHLAIYQVTNLTI
ncbi:MAG TPA: hypothetical protein VJJ52_07180 [Candidatus Nanoarchaeia archaeon]|nr:hypothetical protein [Candidatus Nanoarchaeia archaeon]